LDSTCSLGTNRHWGEVTGAWS